MKSRTLVFAIVLCCATSFSVFAVAQTTIPAPGFQPSGLAFDGTFLYVLELSGSRPIFKLNPQTGAVLDSFDLGDNPNGLAFDESSTTLFVSDISEFVTEIDTASPLTVFNQFPLPFRGGAIAFDGTNVYIADIDSSDIVVTDRSGAIIRTFTAPLRPAGMTFDPATSHLWAISEFNDIISEFTTEGDLIRQCDGPHNPGIQGLGGVTWVDSKLYIAEVSDPDPFNPPDIPGTIFIVDRRTLSCNPPLIAGLDHFLCYKAKSAEGERKFERRDVDLEDQFRATVKSVKKPKFLCTPVAKDGEPVINPAGHLVCYEVKGHDEFEKRNVLVFNQFEDEVEGRILTIKKPKIVCVPSTKEDLGVVVEDDDDKDRDKRKHNDKDKDEDDDEKDD